MPSRESSGGGGTSLGERMRTAVRRVAAVAATTLLTLTLAGCGGDPADTSGSASAPVASASAPAPAPVENVVTITGVDYGYTLDKPAVDSGTTKINFVNAGKDAHMLAVAQMAPGKVLKDVIAALQSEDRKDDEAVLPSAGGDDPGVPGVPEPLSPGAKTATYTELKPGSYALICFFPTPDGRPHFLAGMVNELKVNEAATTMPVPETTAEASLTEGKITLPDLASGQATLKVSNTGKETHNFTVVAPVAGTTFDETLKLVDAYFIGKSKVDSIAGVFQGGLTALQPGASGYLELDLPAGTYYVLCTEGDGENQEHFRVGGEKAEFTVT